MDHGIKYLNGNLHDNFQYFICYCSNLFYLRQLKTVMVQFTFHTFPSVAAAYHAAGTTVITTTTTLV